MPRRHPEYEALKWVTTVTPALAVLGFESARHNFLERLFPVSYGNILAGFLTLVASAIFTQAIFRIIERLQDEANTHDRDMAALTAMAEERKRIGHELHDGLAQLVAYLLVRLDTVAGLVREDKRTEALDELEKLHDVGEDLYTDVREAIIGLRTRVIEIGLVPAIRNYAEAFEDRHAIQVNLKVDDTIDVSPPVAFQLFRIVQEALTNVRKHANASEASVSLRRTETTLSVSIDDDGQGFNPHEVGDSTRYGLAMMRERAQSIDGVVEVQSGPAGTHIRIDVPAYSKERHGAMVRLTG